jgi:outer membrane cobalamin receptor
LNQGSLKVRGADVTAKTQESSWGQIAVHYGLLDYSSYSSRPLRRPPYYGNMKWSKKKHRLEWEVMMQFLGGRWDRDFDSQQVKLGAYELLHFRSRYALGQQQELVVSLGNLTNRSYEDIWGYSTAPLNYSLSWNLKW